MPRLSTLCASIGSSAPSMRHIICRISATDTGAVLAAISRASARAVGSNSSGGTTLLTRWPASASGAGGKVGAGAEGAPGTGDDDGADVVVLVGRVEGVDQFLLHRGVEGVELVRPVQRDRENLLGDLILDRLVGHGGFPSCPFEF